MTRSKADTPAMKAIILAGGSGRRLYPVTLTVNKHLLPIYNKPMIYYPLSLVMLMGIREVLLVVNPQDLQDFQRLFGDGSHLGMRIAYTVQPEPRGLAEGLVLGAEFLAGAPVCYVLGDNVFFGHALPDLLREARRTVEQEGGALVFGYPVKDPQRFGVVEFDETGRVRSLEEKPEHPKSNFAVVGLYLYDAEAPAIARTVRPSARNELEITEVNRAYLRRGRLRVRLLGRGFAWFDAGTHDSFLEAGEFVATIERRTGTMIGCIEEIAFLNGWIGREDLRRLARPLENTEYGRYLLELAER